MIFHERSRFATRVQHLISVYHRYNVMGSESSREFYGAVFAIVTAQGQAKFYQAAVKYLHL